MWKQSQEGTKNMRKAMLTAISVGMSGILLMMFVISVAWQWGNVHAQELPAQDLSFPYEIADTDMRALQLVRYEGPFWEDDSETEVADVAALLIENTGGYLAEGAVVLEWEDARMVFELYDIPQNEKVLVLEKDRQRFQKGIPTACYGWKTEAYPENSGFVTVEDAGGMCMTIANVTDGKLPVVQICYKSCDPGSGMFIGGISYRTEVRDLLPGERRHISPYHYASGSSKVVQVMTWVEE